MVCFGAFYSLIHRWILSGHCYAQDAAFFYNFSNRGIVICGYDELRITVLHRTVWKWIFPQILGMISIFV